LARHLREAPGERQKTLKVGRVLRTALHAGPSAPKSFTPIENEKTIDFSTGKPVVKDSAEEKAIIERSLKK
jgi:hypothetical protein